MRLFRSIFLLIFCFSLSFGAFSQSDTACVKTRWISVKNHEQNAVLFDTTTSILKTIRDLVHENKLTIYHQENTRFNSGKWYPIPLVDIDSTYIDYGSYESDIYNEIFTIRVQSDIALVDEYGDQLIKTDDYGMEYFVYPKPDLYVFRIEDITEIRIREERKYTKINSAFEDDFHPTGISFFIKNNYETRELFWVDLNELNSKIENTHPWQSFLQNKEYSGFQYMQVSCYDDLIRY